MIGKWKKIKDKYLAYKPFQNIEVCKNELEMITPVIKDVVLKWLCLNIEPQGLGKIDIKCLLKRFEFN